MCLSMLVAACFSNAIFFFFFCRQKHDAVVTKPYNLCSSELPCFFSPFIEYIMMLVGLTDSKAKKSQTQTTEVYYIFFDN